MKHTLVTLIICACAMITGCNQTAPRHIESLLRQSEMALAQGDMTAAEAVARTIDATDIATGLTATQLARLSMVYMQIADSTGNETTIATATKLYRQALHTDSDSVAAYCASLPTELYPHATLLGTLVHNSEHPYHPEHDHDIAPDSI